MADRPKSIITKWMDFCMICGRPTEEVHHALWGNKHKLADQDHLLMPLCSYHHNSMNTYEVKRKPVVNMSVHHCEEMRILSQQLAQMCWEREYLADYIANLTDEEGNYIYSKEKVMQEAKDAFFKRYGEFYL